MYRKSSQESIRAHRIALTTHCLDGREGDDCSCQLLDDHLHYLKQALQGDRQLENVSQIQEMLLELSLVIRSRALGLSASGHQQILERLSDIYAEGLDLRGSNAFLLTSADYADVVEAIGNRLAGHDYGRVIGQLLFYMAQLYLTRKGSWSTIYEHLIAMPGSIPGIASLKQKCFAEIHRWAEEGVANLFQIQRDIQARQAHLWSKGLRIRKRIDWLKAGCGPGFDPDRPFAGRPVASLDQYRVVNQIRALQQELRLIQQELDGKQETAQLIESNILEFEQKLQAARRTYLIQAVS